MEEDNETRVEPKVDKTNTGDSKGKESLQKRSLKGWLLEPGIMIALASALAYLCAYIYEKSYCDYFGIPADLISISWTRFFSYAPIIIVLPISYLIIRTWPTLKSAFYTFCLALALMFVFKFTGAITSWRTFSIVAISLFCFLFIPMLSLYTIKSFRLATTLERRAAWRLSSESARHVLVVIIISFAIIFLYGYTNGGAQEANTRLIYSIQSVPQNPSIANLSVEELYERNQNAQNLAEQNLVVLRIYGDKVICAPWYIDDQSGNYITKEFVILPLKNITLTPKQIGPLHSK